MESLWLINLLLCLWLLFLKTISNPQAEWDDSDDL
ncbi:hypothetical protein JOC69_000590 [Heliobacterium gestii]|nr:hypothetical protein [Heliomicrobium gestii]